MVEHLSCLYSIQVWHYLGKKYFPNYQPWVTVKHLIGRKSIIKQFFRLPKHEINNNITLDMISLEDSYIEQSSDTLESRALKLQNYSFVWQMQRVWQYFINHLFYRLNNQRCFIHAVIFYQKIVKCHCALQISSIAVTMMWFITHSWRYLPQLFFHQQ